MSRAHIEKDNINHIYFLQPPQTDSELHRQITNSYREHVFCFSTMFTTSESLLAIWMLKYEENTSSEIQKYHIINPNQIWILWYQYDF